MEKMKLHSPNLTQENIARIRDLFPGCVTEAPGEEGRLKLLIDFDQLRQELSQSIVEGPQERYHLNWPGKRQALLTANAPIAKTLRPCREESVDFDTTKNLFIEGDNLDALKLLQETYLGKIKMIYIDPPYNTGNDFLYKDNFAQSSEKFLRDSFQKDDEGMRLLANTSATGRFHSNWLSMMYSRLFLARNLLREDGIIFVSIDDNEVHNLRAIMTEIFGEKNFIVQFIWKSKSGGANDSKFVAVDHEYVIAFSRNSEKLVLNMDKDATVTTSYNLSDERGLYSLDRLDKQSLGYIQSLDFPIEGPDGKIYAVLHKDPNNKVARWRWGKDTVRERYDELVFKDGFVYTKNYKKEGAIPRSLLIQERFGRTRTGKTDFAALMPAIPFDNPKPPKLIKFLLQIVTSQDDLILDFFAGSGTTADALMQVNSKDNGQRKFILIQLPEPCDKKSDLIKKGFNTIADIAKERIRRVGRKIKEGSTIPIHNQDIGFRILKVDTSNMEDVYYTPDTFEQDLVSIMAGNIKSNRTAADLLFQVLLYWGVDLTLPISEQVINGKTVFYVDSNSLVACFDMYIDESLITKLARAKPLRVVFRDDGFQSDTAKINAEQIFRQLSPNTEMKSI
ncbi:MAG: site-specific DNA-methyltransferase [Deltaproteobacteria bacterium]|nr:site-specific DNA-methyltransferase [Deltaproteobacteria bacterium]